MPLGAPGSNSNGPNFSPPFPAYPSGHAGFGGTLFQILRRFYGTDRHRVHVRLGRVQRHDARQQRQHPSAAPAQLRRLSEAEEENGQSRIYLGIHWAFDKSEGITQGQQVADYVWFRTYRPTR